MKTKIIPIIAIFTVAAILFSSCEDSTYREYTGNAPVYMSYENLRSSVKTQQNVDLKDPGKIYYKDNYIFIVEELKGIHVYDNTDPASPVKKVFVNLPGVIDISISGFILYADSYIDLVILDVQNIDNIHEVARVKGVLPYTVPPADNDYPKAYVDEEKGVVIEWEVKTIKERIYNEPYPWPIYYKGGVAFLDATNSSGASSGVSGSGTGFGGSMARFGIKDKVLYIVDQNTLKIFDITNKTSPVKMGDFNPGWNIETMFLSGNNMFLGTTTGMIIYDISNPLVPSTRVFFNHARSCDPVIVDDTLAYITLRTGTTCGGTTNCLDVVNIKKISTPSMVATFSMTNPHGLGKKGDLLFICDGSAGLKIYDASEPKTIGSKLVYSYPNINAFDVIPIGNLLIMIGDNGLYQYNYSDIRNITLLSKIEVKK
ncbi:MAG TPA: hypothetical protein DEO60_04680 [Bacteroidales bacterium]|nr:hypothetical protein [Bacteroidales bacterium]HBZ20403.1 hypothetical protein [Bacteroidales bacterium]